MTTYSIDLRKKVFDAYENSRTKDKEKIAKRFKVSYDFVNDLMNLFAETGSIEPRKGAVGRSSKLNQEEYDFLYSTVKSSNDKTLSELCDLLEKEKGMKVGTTVMFRALKKLNLTLKKSHSNQMREIPRK
jgi:transposase